MASPSRKRGSQTVELLPNVQTRDYADVGMDIDMPVEVEAEAVEETAWIRGPDTRSEVSFA